ncbi:MAG: hypothetical protein HQ582_24850 [Planctomycetes bacterium]|nr:hypothetical protein [Planctomycetota bacterium]
MRRSVVCAWLVVVAVSCLFGWSTGVAAAPLQVATFQCDVTPPLGEAIYSGYQPLATVEHPLLAKGIVLDDGRRRYVLCSVDWCELCNSTHTLFRQKMAAAAGTETACVAVHTIHQHTAPMGDADAFKLLEKLENPPPHPRPALFEEMAGRVARAVEQSLQRLEPFDSLGTGQAKVERVASSRRVPIEGGGIRVRWSSCRDPDLRAEPEGYIDPYLKTVTLARGNKPLVRMHYYATHPQSFYGDPRASYDFPGIAREALQQEEDVFQIYFNGCGGDVTAGKYNDGSPKARDELAARLLAGMKASVASTRLQPAPVIEWRTTPVILPLRTDPGYTAADRSEAMGNAKLSPSTRIYRGAMRIAFADRIEEPIQLSSLEIGPVRILHLPGESMIEFQLYAQRLLADGFVAVAAYGDCGPGYICTEKAFDEGGYEPTDSLVVPRSESILKTAIRQLLGVE